MLWHQTWKESVKKQDPNTDDGNNSAITCNTSLCKVQIWKKRGSRQGSIQVNQATDRVHMWFIDRHTDWACYDMQTDVLAWDLANSVGHQKLLNTTWEIVGDSKEQREKVTKGTQTGAGASWVSQVVKGKSCEEDQTAPVLEGEHCGPLVEGSALQGLVK